MNLQGRLNIQKGERWSLIDLDVSARHRPAGFCTSGAGLSAGFAMGLLVLGALGRAGFADLGAQGADFLGVHATAGHEASRETADCSAVDVVAAHRDFKRSLEACGRPDWRMGGR